MSHETPLTTVVFQKPDGTTGELDIHDGEAIHDVENSVDASNITPGSVTNDKLSDDAVDSVNIVNGAVTKDKLSEGLQEDWDSLSQNMSKGLFQVKQTTKSYSVETNGYGFVQTPLQAVAGYNPVGVVGFNAGVGRWAVMAVSSDDANCYAEVRNINSAAQSATFVFNILYIRNNLNA